MCCSSWKINVRWQLSLSHWCSIWLCHWMKECGCGQRGFVNPSRACDMHTACQEVLPGRLVSEMKHSFASTFSWDQRRGQIVNKSVCWLEKESVNLKGQHKAMKLSWTMWVTGSVFCANDMGQGHQVIGQSEDRTTEQAWNTYSFMSLFTPMNLSLTCFSSSPKIWPVNQTPTPTDCLSPSDMSTHIIVSVCQLVGAGVWGRGSRTVVWWGRMWRLCIYVWL